MGLLQNLRGQMMSSPLSQGMIKQQARALSTQGPHSSHRVSLAFVMAYEAVETLNGHCSSQEALVWQVKGSWNGSWGRGHFSRLLLCSVPAPLTLTSGPFSLAAGTLGARGTNLHTVAWPVRQMRVWARKRIAALSAAPAPRPPPTHAMGSSVTAATVSSSATMR